MYMLQLALLLLLQLLSILARLSSELPKLMVREHVEAYSCMAKQQYKKQQVQVRRAGRGGGVSTGQLKRMA
jgi:hypothetical protein